MKELTAFVRFGDQVHLIEALQLGGEIWLVLRWSERQDTAERSPDLAIRAHQIQWEAPFGADLTVGQTLPKAWLDPDTASIPEDGYEVIRGFSTRFGWLPARKVS